VLKKNTKIIINEMKTKSILQGAIAHKKNQILLLIIMIIITSFFDALSIGVLLPVIQIIVGVESGGIIGEVLSGWSENYEKDHILALMLIIFFFLVLLKNIFTFIKNKFQSELFDGFRGYWMQKLMKRYLYAKYAQCLNI